MKKSKTSARTRKARSLYAVDMPRQRPAKYLRDAKTGKPIMLADTPEGRAAARAGAAAAKRLMKAFGVKRHIEAR